MAVLPVHPVVRCSIFGKRENDTSLCTRQGNKKSAGFFCWLARKPLEGCVFQTNKNNRVVFKPFAFVHRHDWDGVIAIISGAILWRVVAERPNAKHSILIQWFVVIAFGIILIFLLTELGFSLFSPWIHSASSGSNTVPSDSKLFCDVDVMHREALQIHLNIRNVGEIAQLRSIKLTPKSVWTINVTEAQVVRPSAERQLGGYFAGDEAPISIPMSLAIEHEKAISTWVEVGWRPMVQGTLHFVFASATLSYNDGRQPITLPNLILATDGVLNTIDSEHPYSIDQANILCASEIRRIALADRGIQLDPEVKRFLNSEPRRLTDTRSPNASSTTLPSSSLDAQKSPPSDADDLSEHKKSGGAATTRPDGIYVDRWKVDLFPDELPSFPRVRVWFTNDTRRTRLCTGISWQPTSFEPLRRHAEARRKDNVQYETRANEIIFTSGGQSFSHSVVSSSRYFLVGPSDDIAVRGINEGIVLFADGFESPEDSDHEVIGLKGVCKGKLVFTFDDGESQIARHHWSPIRHQSLVNHLKSCKTRK